MKKTTTIRKPNRRPSRERKNESGVQNQLSKLRTNSASRKRTEKLDMNTTLEQPITEAQETATVDQPQNPKSGFSRGMLGKVRRAHIKAGIAEPTDALCEAFVRNLLATAVPIMKRSSTRIAKVIKGEVEIEALK
jgi:hypothetical protein